MRSCDIINILASTLSMQQAPDGLGVNQRRRRRAIRLSGCAAHKAGKKTEP